MVSDECVSDMIRVSLGSAIVIGLARGSLDAPPTTVYLLTYKKGRCNANCAFCPQARNSKSRADMLSRVTWPPFSKTDVIDGIENAFRNRKIERVCIQALNYPSVFEDVLGFVSRVRSRCDVPISVSCQPVNAETMTKLAKAGVERIGIPLDAATEEIFDRIKGKEAKGPYSWKKQLQTLEDAVGIFGKGKVSTHLIAGLGETEKDMMQTIQHCVDIDVCPGLFAFTPVPGTELESFSPPSFSMYRRVQLARHLIVQKKTTCANMRFGSDGHIVDFGVSESVLRQAIKSGSPFATSGCPHCNRPYYNEKPGGPLYNYPYAPTDSELAEIEKLIKT